MFSELRFLYVKNEDNAYLPGVILTIFNKW